MLASRLSSISESKSVSTSNKAAELVKAGKRVYNFGIGEPDFTTPEPIIKAGYEASLKGKTHYTSSYGIVELREAIAKKMFEVNNVRTTFKNVLVTPTKFSLNLTVMSLMNPGDEAILPEPYYLSYPDIVRLHGGKVLTSPTDENYSFDFDDMRKLVSPRTKMVIISNPTNPTGKVYSEKELRKLCDFVLENNMYLLSDEIYEDLIFEGKMFSPAS
ncbi:MAG: aminotransferase class I/II-fold pyridoxal phosphate-dependent enzyme, partial [Candidatus Thermoplasmatota archaeon]|nr:aminotransferase class I/II-fold pyridoxal phosphate-dependent enzyme [Candidatus Thermoplasmatota archaeon]